MSYQKLSAQDNSPKVPTPLHDMKVFDLADQYLYGGKNYGILAFARAIEAALGIGEPPQITHAEGCWSWGPAHYECACAEIAKAKGWAK